MAPSPRCSVTRVPPSKRPKTLLIQKNNEFLGYSVSQQKFSQSQTLGLRKRGWLPVTVQARFFFHGYSRLPCRISFWLSNDNSPPATSPELAKLVKLWQIHREFFIVIVAESVYYKRQNSARFCTNWTKNSKSCLVLVQHLRNIFKGDSWAWQGWATWRWWDSRPFLFRCTIRKKTSPYNLLQVYAC